MLPEFEPTKCFIETKRKSVFTHKHATATLQGDHFAPNKFRAGSWTTLRDIPGSPASRPVAVAVSGSLSPSQPPSILLC